MIQDTQWSAEWKLAVIINDILRKSSVPVTLMRTRVMKLLCPSDWTPHQYSAECWVTWLMIPVRSCCSLSSYSWIFFFTDVSSTQRSDPDLLQINFTSALWDCGYLQLMFTDPPAAADRLMLFSQQSAVWESNQAHIKPQIHQFTTETNAWVNESSSPSLMFRRNSEKKL